MARASRPNRIGIRTALLTVLALLSFAANSVLCRLALRGGEIGAAEFTAIRLASGAALLWAIVVLPRLRRGEPKGGSLASGAALWLYAIAFSIAYLWLGIGPGALLLFGFVQATILAWGIATGDRPRPIQWAGIVLAAGGLAALVLPGWESPSPAGAALMGLAGIAWGVYTVRGKRETNPAAATAANFAWSAPLGLATVAIVWAAGGASAPSAAGVGYALASGAATSGLGYIAWYAALPRLSAPIAAVVQLAVPVIAGAAGALLAQEPLAPRLLLAGAATLGGIALTTFTGRRST